MNDKPIFFPDMYEYSAACSCVLPADCVRKRHSG